MKKLLMIVLVVALVSSIAACGKKEEPVEPDKVTFILDWAPNTNHTGIYSAIEQGYFEDVNIEVEVIQPSGGTAEALVATGQGEFGVSFQETVTVARTSDNPVPVVAVAAILQHNTSGFASLGEKGIETPKDFEGKIYGSWGTEIETAFIRTLMDKDGGNIDELSIIDIVSWDFLTSITNDVDLQWIYYGWDGVGAELNGVDLNFIKLQDIDDRLDFYTPVIISSEELIAENPDLVSRFLEAASKGYEYAVENPKEAAADLLKHAPELDEALVIASQEYLASEYIADAKSWGVMKEEIWTNFSAWMLENNVISKELEVEKAYTNEFLPGKGQ